MELVHMAFQDRFLAEEATCQVLVLIPKGVINYCGIGLVEVVWKVVAVNLNHRFTASITYHDFLHWLNLGHGTGTATLDVKLLHAIFLYLYKVYNALERSRCLEIL